MTSASRDVPVDRDASAATRTGPGGPGEPVAPTAPGVPVTLAVTVPLTVPAVPDAPGIAVETDVLARRVETYLTVARTALRGPDLELAERLAVALRQLVADTTAASAADRARVRAAVHALVLRREAHGRVLPRRSLAAAQQVINQVVRQLGRPDLAVLSTSDGTGTTTNPVDSPCAVG